jgi:potassium efflux system protein
MNEQYAKLITGFPLFHGFTVHGTQRLLDEGEIKEYAPGEVLIREGDPPAFVSLVLTGNLEVFVEREGKHLVLTEARPGSILGELAVLCGIPRSASVRASENSVVLQWSADTFRAMLIRDPSLSEHIFEEALRILIKKERSLIDSLVKSQAAGGQG